MKIIVESSYKSIILKSLFHFSLICLFNNYFFFNSFLNNEIENLQKKIISITIIFSLISQLLYLYDMWILYII